MRLGLPAWAPLQTGAWRWSANNCGGHRHLPPPAPRHPRRGRRHHLPRQAQAHPERLPRSHPPASAQRNGGHKPRWSTRPAARGCRVVGRCRGRGPTAEYKFAPGGGCRHRGLVLADSRLCPAHIPNPRMRPLHHRKAGAFARCPTPYWAWAESPLNLIEIIPRRKPVRHATPLTARGRNLPCAVPHRQGVRMSLAHRIHQRALTPSPPQQRPVARPRPRCGSARRGPVGDAGGRRLPDAAGHGRQALALWRGSILGAGCWVGWQNWLRQRAGQRRADARRQAARLRGCPSC